MARMVVNPHKELAARVLIFAAKAAKHGDVSAVHWLRFGDIELYCDIANIEPETIRRWADGIDYRRTRICTANAMARLITE